MAAQDDARENQIVDLFNLERPAHRMRHGTDAVLNYNGLELEFELKSVTTAKGNVSTVRDLGKDHIHKWKNKHWIIAYYKDGKLDYCKYATPDFMASWIEKIWAYVAPDFHIAEIVPPLVNMEEMQEVIGKKESYSFTDAFALNKKQYTTAQYKDLMDIDGGYSPNRMLEIFRDRTRYTLERGATLNNPHIPDSHFGPLPEIRKNHAATLRASIKQWLDEKA